MCPALALSDGSDGIIRTGSSDDRFELDAVPLPARHLVHAWRGQYACLAHRPTWLVETARGCPFRCSFCSIWQLHARSVRERSIESVCQDMASCGNDLFIADDLFWYHPSRSKALALELRRRGIRKKWILVQSRTDLVARHSDLLEVWRPIADKFDIFFGLEAATNEGLTTLTKDATVDQTAEGIAVARGLGYGVTGNFVIDPAWGEADFERLWGFVERHRLFQAGFTILTPLPGTAYFEEMQPRLKARRWAQFDMHHLLWEPALGPERFFELYCETWRRSVLNLRGRKTVWQWLRQVDAAQRAVPDARAGPNPADDGPRALSRRIRPDQRRPVGRGAAPRRRYLKSAGSIGALGLTSVNVISFVSPLGNVMRIAVISWRRAIHPQLELRRDPPESVSVSGSSPPHRCRADPSPPAP